MHRELRLGFLRLARQQRLQRPGTEEGGKARQLAQREKHRCQPVFRDIDDHALFGLRGRGCAEAMGGKADRLAAQLIFAEFGQRPALEMAELGLAAVHHGQFGIVEKDLDIADPHFRIRRQGMDGGGQQRLRLHAGFRQPLELADFFAAACR